MHIFKRIIPMRDSLRYCLDLSASQASSLGHLVGDIYYKRPGFLAIGIEHMSGFPHNGGQHTMRLVGDRDDLVAWLNLVVETYRQINYTRFQEACNTLQMLSNTLQEKPNYPEH